MHYTVITGASSGIGYEAALGFASRGKNIVLVARREKELNELKEKIEQYYPTVEVIVYPADLTETSQVHALYEFTRQLTVDTWINNAGFGNFDSVTEQSLSKIEKLLDLNIKALTVLSTLYVKDYADVKGAQLLNISSTGGYNIVKDAVTYCASKFYVSAFTEGLAQELKENGHELQAKVLAPSATETEFSKRAFDVTEFDYTESGRMFNTAKEMADYLLTLYDDEQTVGMVSPYTGELALSAPIFPYVGMHERK